MKKVVILVLAILFVLCPSRVYAETLTYDVYINHVKQPFFGKMDKELLLPVNETYDMLGAKHIYDKKFNSDVYIFSDYLVESYRDEKVVFSKSSHLGYTVTIDGVDYGSKNIFDIDVATMIVDHKNKKVSFLSRSYIENILVGEMNELKKSEPNLVTAISSILNTGTEMKFNVNTTLISHSTVSTQTPYMRTFVKVDGWGYASLKDKICDVIFNVRVDKNKRTNTVKGFEARILDDVLYIMNPSNKKWLNQKNRNRFGVVSSMALTHEDTFFIGALREYLVKTNLESGDVEYSIHLSEEILSDASKTSAYGDVIQAIEEELNSGGNSYKLSTLDVRFIVKDNKIKIIHAEVFLNQAKDNSVATISIAADIEFLNQGLKKEVVLPEQEKWNSHNDK